MKLNTKGRTFTKANNDQEFKNATLFLIQSLVSPIGNQERFALKDKVELLMIILGLNSDNLGS